MLRGEHFTRDVAVRTARTVFHEGLIMSVSRPGPSVTKTESSCGVSCKSGPKMLSWATKTRSSCNSGFVYRPTHLEQNPAALEQDGCGERGVKKSSRVRCV